MKGAFTKHFAQAEQNSGHCRKQWLSQCGISGGSWKADRSGSQATPNTVTSDELGERQCF